VSETHRRQRGGAARGGRTGQRAQAGWPAVNDAQIEWALLGITRRQAVQRLLEEWEEVVDHGLSRIRLGDDRQPVAGRFQGKWFGGFVVLTTERLIWQSETDANHAYIVAFDDMEKYRARVGYTSSRLFVTTADHTIRYAVGSVLIHSLSAGLDEAGVPAG
jgi:hypothetical protein